MNKLDTNKLIAHKSIIHHDLYQDGRFVKKEYDSIYVQFEHECIQLFLNNYQKKWYVKNFSGYQFDGSKILDASINFENSFLKGTIGIIDNELRKTATELYDLPDMCYGSEMAKIAKRKSQLEAKKQTLIKMKWNPYFARIDLVKSDQPDAGVSYYIRDITGDRQKSGALPVAIDELDNIVDWYSQQAMPYYDQEMFTNEEAENKLVLLRDYQIKGDELETFEDNLKSDKDLIEQVADERLKKHIQRNRDKHIRNIIQTIKTNQYRIISHNQNRNILVHGCAGSGKTMILAHRLSFWMFRMQGKLDMADAFIISPTKLLSNEMTKLDLDINQAKFMSNLEFNKYLISHLCGQLGADCNLDEVYLSNNFLDDVFIKETYSGRNFNDLELSIDLLLGQDDEYLVEDFKEYLEEKLDRSLQQVFNTKKEINRASREEYGLAYGSLMARLEQLTYLELIDYRNQGESAINQVMELQRQTTEWESKLDHSKEKYKEVLEEIISNHPEYADQTVEYVARLCEEWKTEIDQMQNEIEEFSSLISSFKQDIANLAILEQRHGELLQEKPRFSFFARARHDEEISGSRKGLEDKKTEIESTYGQYGLDEGTDIEDVTGWIEKLRIYLNQELVLCNRLNRTLTETVEANKELQKVNDQLDVVTVDIETIEGQLPLVRELIANRSLLVNEVRHQGDTSERIAAIKQVKLPTRQNVVNFILKYRQYQSSNEFGIIKDYLEDGKTEGILMMIVDFVIANYKNDNGIDGKHYEFEIFLKLYLLQASLNVSKIANKWLFIDEFQDYSYWEIEMYRQLFKNTTFNYFGDMRQNINAKGLGPAELELLTNNKFDLFEINENYRNAKEITEYVNEKFKLNMYSIGLEGKVIHCDLDTFLGSVTLKKGASVAIVVGNGSPRDRLEKHSFDGRLAFISEDDPTVDESKINVLTPLSIKGLEFDTVCVLEAGMADNEKYVCYTRALKNLYIVGDNHDEA